MTREERISRRKNRDGQSWEQGVPERYKGYKVNQSRSREGHSPRQEIIHFFIKSLAKVKRGQAA